jgi:hypothetical protein
VAARYAAARPPTKKRMKHGVTPDVRAPLSYSHFLVVNRYIPEQQIFPQQPDSGEAGVAPCKNDMKVASSA